MGTYTCTKHAHRGWNHAFSATAGVELWPECVRGHEGAAKRQGKHCAVQVRAGGELGW